MPKLRYPHPELFRSIVEEIRSNVIEERTCDVGGIEITYTVSSWQGGDPGMWDEDGNVYVHESLALRDVTTADLVAFHEKTEIDNKLAGRSHAYAHRRALLLELLAAKETYVDFGRFRDYVHWRLSGYTGWKVPNRKKSQVVYATFSIKIVLREESC